MRGNGSRIPHQCCTSPEYPKLHVDHQMFSCAPYIGSAHWVFSAVHLPWAGSLPLILGPALVPAPPSRLWGQEVTLLGLGLCCPGAPSTPSLSWVQSGAGHAASAARGLHLSSTLNTLGDLSQQRLAGSNLWRGWVRGACRICCSLL